MCTTIVPCMVVGGRKITHSSKECKGSAMVHTLYNAAYFVWQKGHVLEQRDIQHKPLAIASYVLYEKNCHIAILTCRKGSSENALEVD